MVSVMVESLSCSKVTLISLPLCLSPSLGRIYGLGMCQLGELTYGNTRGTIQHPAGLVSERFLIYAYPWLKLDVPYFIPKVHRFSKCANLLFEVTGTTICDKHWLVRQMAQEGQNWSENSWRPCTYSVYFAVDPNSNVLVRSGPNNSLGSWRGYKATNISLWGHHLVPLVI